MTSDRLKRIVRVRRLMESSRAAELGASRSRLAGARRELDEAGRRIDDHDRTVDELDLDPTLQEAARRYRNKLSRGRAERAASVETHRDRVAEGQRVVTRAHQDRRLMEKLHDRVRARELQTLAEGEAKTQDAIALSSHARNGGSGR